MRPHLTHWPIHPEYRADWLRQANNERLARQAADDPDHYLPGDVAWVVSAVKSVTRWLASGLGNQRPTSETPRYPIGTQQKHTV